MRSPDRPGLPGTGPTLVPPQPAAHRPLKPQRQRGDDDDAERGTQSRFFDLPGVAQEVVTRQRDGFGRDRRVKFDLPGVA